MQRLDENSPLAEFESTECTRCHNLCGPYLRHDDDLETLIWGEAFVTAGGDIVCEDCVTPADTDDDYEPSVCSSCGAPGTCDCSTFDTYPFEED